MLLMELRPRGYPSVLLAQVSVDFLKTQVKPLRLSVLHPPMALFFAMLFWPCPVLDPMKYLLQALNQMQATGRVHYARDVTGLECKCGVLELLLHVAAAEIPQVTPLTSAAAIGLGNCEVAEGDLAALDALLVSLDDLLCFVFAASDV
jgi:hypothetical protein